MKKVFKIIGRIILGVILAVVLFFGVLLIAQYRPEDSETIAENQEGTKTLVQGDTVKVMTWNAGYCSLGNYCDFFMDGGSMVTTSTKEQVLNNLSAIEEVIANEDPDVVFLQEVDRDSKRSYHINEVEEISDNDSYVSTFATNYKALYVPYPIPNIGKVHSGIVTLQKYDLTESTREQLYCPFNWFVRAFNLRRCLMVNRIPIEGTDKELVVKSSLRGL